MALKPGDRIDRYVIEAPLGQGGMGEVYRAHDARLKRSIALKILLSEAVDPTAKTSAPSSGQAERMVREAQLAASLDHPNVTAVFDVGRIDEPPELRGTPFIAMELIRGDPLRKYVGDAGVKMRTRLKWLEEIARALGAAHAAGLVHRDMKPENVMIREDGLVKVLDFGIAKRTASAPADPTSSTEGYTLSNMTAKGVVIGTPLYMAPEQIKAQVVDGRTDQFAWGVMAYELLTGKVPWSLEGGGLALVAQILQDTAPSLEGVEGVPPEVAAVVARAMQKDPAARFESMRELLEALTGRTEAGDTASRIPIASPSGDALPSPQTTTKRSAPTTPGSGATATAARPGRRRWILAASALAGALVVARYELRAPAAAPAPAATSSPPAAALEESQPSGNPEAVAAYKAGLQSLHDASNEDALASFERAIHLDPGYAAAHLQRALMSSYLDPTARESYARVFPLRASLGQRDRLLLDALTAALRVPSDDAAIEAALGALLRAPDAESAFAVCHWRVLQEQYAEARRACGAVLDRDPPHAGAHAMLARALSNLDDVPGANKQYAACLEASPAATSCLWDLASLDRNEGQCAQAVALERRLIAAEPGQPAAFALLAGTLDDAPESRAAREEALRQYWHHLPEAARAVSEPQQHARVAVYRGDFKAAQRAMDDWGRALESDSRENQARVELLQEQTMLDFETGRASDAVTAARSYLGQRVAWVSDMDGSIDAYVVLYEAGKLTRAEFAAHRDEWLKTAEAQAFPWWGWLRAFAKPSVTADDAREAIAAQVRFGAPAGPVDRSSETDFLLGRMFLRAGDLGQAIPYLKRATASCDAVSRPFQHVRGAALLASALEAKGDVEGACAMLRGVLDRWGGAVPASQTARVAGTARAKLRCGP